MNAQSWKLRQFFKKPQTLVSQKSRHDLAEHIAFFKQKQEDRESDHAK